MEGTVMTPERPTGRHACIQFLVMGWLTMSLMAAGAVSAQQTPQQAPPGACNTPAAERKGEIGCYLDASEELGTLPQGPWFWHLDNYPTRAAAEAAKGPRGTVVESFGKIWLYTIAEEGWRAAGGGKHVATIGPLATEPGKKYTARYMEAVFAEGMHSTLHRHSGAEAWYVLSGAQCLETPDGTIIAHAGEGAVVPQGPPMRLSSMGTETRRSVLIVLHDSALPWVNYASDWQPRGLCPK
jgi:quercetin dioxygenase-like cupin family protein